MVNNDIFYAFLISNLEIEFLKKEDPMNESGLGILLRHEVPKRRMIGESPTRVINHVLFVINALS